MSIHDKMKQEKKRKNKKIKENKRKNKKIIEKRREESVLQMLEIHIKIVK